MHRYRWALAFGSTLYVVAAIAASTGAHAQTAPLGTEASQQADDLFKKGKDLYQRGKLREAYEAYRDAWKLKQSYDIAANLANTELQLGMEIEAAEHLAFCIRNFPATGDKAQIDRVRAQFEAVRKELGALVVRANIEGAELFVDGVSVGRAPLGREVFVKPGAHVVEAKLPGYAPTKQEVVATLGPAQEVALVLMEMKPKELPHQQQQPSGVQPSAVVGDTQGVRSPIADDGNRPPVRTVVLVAGGAAAGAGLVAGIIFTVVANGHASDAEAQRGALTAAGGPSVCAAMTPACEELRSSMQGAADFGSAAIWSFVGAGVVGAATAIYGVTTARSAVQVGVGPTLMGQGGGVLVRGRW
jgi:hypothetical protein